MSQGERTIASSVPMSHVTEFEAFYELFEQRLLARQQCCSSHCVLGISASSLASQRPQGQR
ncbi:hypothetical protein G3435_14435 [Pseudomonas sp. MAFF212428]|uniref:Uncharacterized protein n=1 Tax=Pseudomonas brassicae TaxID=2708063 RepID=A0A6B3NRP5_9PSED|nr:hypothetical protein [Pseudomonas brassicae]NER60853.1 hypothetical protein [Pseudomonas brassicae]NER64566.1 hypothetical protein [Pseudomonas brassicae]